MRGWTDVWLNNDFRAWDLSEDLAYIRVPILIIQGEHDHYGTVRQIEIAREECYCPVEVLLMPGIQHVPHREAPEVTLEAIADFCRSAAARARSAAPLPPPSFRGRKREPESTRSNAPIPDRRCGVRNDVRASGLHALSYMNYNACQPGMADGMANTAR